MASEEGERITVVSPVGAAPTGTEVFTRVAATTTHTSPDAPPAASPFPEIPGYEISSVLGRGGMGIVYLARHVRLNRMVALKMVLAGATAREDVLGRFRKEALAVARLNHPNITQVYDSGEWDSRPYLALEYVEGGTLAARLGGVPQPPRKAAELVETLARAIAHAHQQGIVHRDLKPANILMANNERRTGDSQSPSAINAEQSEIRNPKSEIPKITDFGLVHWLEGDSGHAATRDGEVLGTPSYMAPEQAGGVVRNIGPATDTYALGAILYQLLTGRPPFLSASVMETVLQVLSHDPVPPRRLQPNLPKDLETICLKCLEKLPGKRYSSAESLADDLRRFIDGRPILARPVSIVARFLKWARRRPTAAALVLVSLLALCIILAGGAWYNSRLSSELKRSEQMFGDSQRLIRWLLEEHTDGLLGLRGSTPVQQKLIAQMIVYLDALAAQVAGHERVSGELTVEEIATAYERLSNVQGNPGYFNLGETRPALDSCGKALALRRRVVVARPGDPAAHTSLAKCLMKLSELHAALGEFPAARETLNEARQEIAKAVQVRPDDLDTKMTAIQVLADDADLLDQEGNADGALAGHREALRRLVEEYGDSPSTPKGLIQLATANSRVGRLFEVRGDVNNARKHYEAALALTRKLQAERPKDPRSLRELSVALVAYGDLLTIDKVDGYRLALDSYEQALAIRRAQCKADPEGKSALRDLVLTLERVGLCRQVLKDLAGAADNFREALDLSLQLKRDDPNSLENRRNVWIMHGKLGGILVAAKNPEAEKHFVAMLRLATELTDEHPRSSRDWEGVAEAHLEMPAVRYLNIAPDESLETSLKRCRSAVADCRACLAAYAKVAELGPLEARQASNRDKARMMLETLEKVLIQLETMKK